MVPQNQLMNRHTGAGIQRNVKIGKLNLACKMCLQNLLGTLAHHRVDSGTQSIECKQWEEEDKAKNEGPLAHRIGLPSLFCGTLALSAAAWSNGSSHYNRKDHERRVQEID